MSRDLNPHPVTFIFTRSHSDNSHTTPQSSPHRVTLSLSASAVIFLLPLQFSAEAPGSERERRTQRKEAAHPLGAEFEGRRGCC